MVTPLDIENKKFAKQMMNGYSVDEVDDFLDEVTLDYTKIYKEVAELKKEKGELKTSLEHYKSIEETLQNTLLMAQTTAEDVKNVARQKAEQIISEAKSIAENEAYSLKNEVINIQRDKEEISKQFDIYKAKMESLLISQLELLKEINKN